MQYKISDLITLLGCEVKGDLSLEYISGLAPFFQAKEDNLTFASDEKFLKNLNDTKAKVIIIPDIKVFPNIGKMFLVVRENPRTLMPKLLSFFKRKVKPFEKMIEDSSKIGENVSIGPNVYIGHDTIIEDNVIIYPNVTISEGVKIGEGSIIYSNVTVREFCEIGRNCVIQPGVVIGSDGFGFVKVNGKNTKIDQIGRVIIGNNVEIGSNTTVDRGAIGDTIIEDYTKIDNLVQVAHNVILRENCLIISQVGIAGSAQVGENSTIAGQTGVAGHLKIGKNVIIGAKSGVTGDVEDNQILSGYPLVDHREDLKIRVSMKKIPELVKKVKILEKKLADK